jgi:PAT family acetyl-CoA transporter-like MFS transporter 1
VTFQDVEQDSDESVEDRKESNDETFLKKVTLLTVLYLLQGIPLGLALGSLPYILKKSLSYSDLAIFSLASYPYSLKLLWSPIVDSIYLPSVGRRRSWVIPIQFLICALLYYISTIIDELLNSKVIDINFLSFLFVVLVFFSATQDIAGTLFFFNILVDGWALELLPDENLPYASSCQTIGLNTGYFLSFVIFLALNSPSFCNSYLRSYPMDVGVISLADYFYFWAVVYLITTLYIVIFVKEVFLIILL